MTAARNDDGQFVTSVWTDAAIETLYKFAGKRSAKQIAQMIGASATGQSVRLMASELGVSLRQPGRTGEQHRAERIRTRLKKYGMNLALLRGKWSIFAEVKSGLSLAEVEAFAKLPRFNLSASAQRARLEAEKASEPARPNGRPASLSAAYFDYDSAMALRLALQPRLQARLN